MMLDCDKCIRSPVCPNYKKAFVYCQYYMDEPVEPKHGEWEHWGSPFSDDTIADSIVCSVCKARFVEVKGEVFNFCPNCGARMRGGEK